MHQIHRIGLVVASVTATLALAGAFIVQGYLNARQDAAQATNQATATPTTDPTATLGPVTVYVKPAGTPKVITVTHTAKPVAPRGTPPVIHITVTPTPGGDDGGGDN